ncbi:MAG TPA: exodeoxyribonuclease VII small subunit [Pyrinomonadaceae bacterium]|nr:exodeoxyribonuclease VII small subunit [Pyrinomonadaceae bacterium]
MKKAGAQNQNFEASLAALEKIVRELERGELPLEKSLELFERGVRLSRECQERLQEAERRIEVLLQRDGGGDGRTTSALGTLDADEFDLAGGAVNGLEDAEDDESVF